MKTEEKRKWEQEFQNQTIALYTACQHASIIIKLIICSSSWSIHRLTTTDYLNESKETEELDTPILPLLYYEEVYLQVQVLRNVLQLVGRIEYK